MTEYEQGSAPDGNHYRELAGKLSDLARYCRFTGARQELIRLAMTYDRRGAHFDSQTS